MAARWRRELRARAVRGLLNVAPEPLLRATLRAGASAARFTLYEGRTLANLARALGPGDHRALASAVRAHSARLALEWCRLARGSRSDAERARVAAWVRDTVELDASVARVRELARAGRGVLIVTAHLGNWELLAAALRLAGVKSAAVGRIKPNDPLASWFLEMRASLGVETLDQESSPRKLLEVLRAGRPLGLLCDLAPRRLAGELAPFFGQPALTMSAPAALARAAQLPLVPVRCVARGARYRLMVDEPLELDRALARDLGRADLLARMNRVFERWIREDPEQWAWHQPRWELGRERTPPVTARLAARTR